MNGYTTRGQFRIQPREVEAILYTDAFVAERGMTELERQRGVLAEAEVNRLLKDKGRKALGRASPITMLRWTLGAVLVRVGERLMGVPRIGISPDSAIAPGALRAST